MPLDRGTATTLSTRNGDTKQGDCHQWVGKGCCSRGETYSSTYDNAKQVLATCERKGMSGRSRGHSTSPRDGRGSWVGHRKARRDGSVLRATRPTTLSCLSLDMHGERYMCICASRQRQFGEGVRKREAPTPKAKLRYSKTTAVVVVPLDAGTNLAK